ncbi:hypothetical protein BGZ98_002706, partial [Dissophora globulifera]
LLLDRLYALERRDSDSGSDSFSALSSDSDTSDSSLQEDVYSKRLSPTRKLGKANGTKGARGNSAAGPPTNASAQHPKKPLTKSTAAKDPKPSAATSAPSTITNVGSATQKPKRIHQTNKLRPGLAKVRKVQLLEKDESGSIKLPVTVGIITIQSIGHVVFDREAFHNDRYIFPVGYKMSRSYNSMIDPLSQTTYTCTVIDDGEAPKFQIDAEDQPEKPIIAGTATGAWTHVVKAANAIRKRDHSNSASGPDYFGFSNATIAKMIQDLPNAEKCQSYIMQRFEEPSASSAAASKAATGEKRKMSAISSTSKAGNQDDEDGEHEEGDIEEEEEDDDAYASLGTPGKKKARVSSPKIRHAGFEAPSTDVKQDKSKTFDLSIVEDDLDGGDNESEQTQSDVDTSEPTFKPRAEPIHSIAALGHNQPAIVVTASGDSDMIDIEDHDSEVDVDMDDSVSPTQQDLNATSLAAPGVRAQVEAKATE